MPKNTAAEPLPPPHRATAPYDWGALLALIRAEFSYMEGRIDPPSSMLRLTEAAIAEQAAVAEVWAIGHPPFACVFLRPRQDAFYLGKLAVAVSHRGQGLARQLVEVAALRARAQGLTALELEVRVELVENQRAFAAMGFAETGRTTHPGYDRPTSITMRRPV